MPGIKLASFTLATSRLQRLRLKRSALAMLALLATHPAVAASNGIQALEWRADASPADDIAAAPAPSEHDDVWQRIRSGFRIADEALNNPLVAEHQSWFAARPASVRKLVERSRPYLFHIVEELDRRAMPMEIALLPMIESAFVPTALSPSAASGIWQFIPSTGRVYGLRQDAWYDGRRDFTAATSAALDYLGKLYLDFGDWQLALAAYNCGEGCVGRAIQKNVQLGLPTDFASLTLPNETRHYVPKLLAVRSLIQEPERYGLEIEALPNRPYFNQVTVEASMDVPSAARLAGMSPDEFVALNAAFSRNLIRSDTPVSLLLPVDRIDIFQRNLEAGSWDSWKPYEAKKGETLASIAQRFDVSVARLEAHNQFHLRRGKLVRAQTILVPVKGRASDLPLEAVSAASLASSHETRQGDTLFSIARRYGLTLTQMLHANPSVDAKALRAGQTLVLPAAGAAPLAEAENAPGPLQRVSNAIRVAKPAPSRYTIRAGDTLHGIALRFDLSLRDLKAWNPIVRKANRIRPGQAIVVTRPN